MGEFMEALIKIARLQGEKGLINRDPLVVQVGKIRFRIIELVFLLTFAG
jgi:hypothetical protein